MFRRISNAAEIFFCINSDEREMIFCAICMCDEHRKKKKQTLNQMFLSSSRRNGNSHQKNFAMQTLHIPKIELILQLDTRKNTQNIRTKANDFFFLSRVKKLNWTRLKCSKSNTITSETLCLESANGAIAIKIIFLLLHTHTLRPRFRCSFSTISPLYCCLTLAYQKCV